MNRRVLLAASLCLMAVFLGSGVAGQAAPQTYKGLEIAIAKVERAPSANLRDCPPGSNTVNAVSRPGEEYAIVHVNMKVTPGFKPMALKRPTLGDEAGKSYNTAVSFVDVGSTPEFSCTFPYRIAQGTKLKKFQIESLTFDLTTLEGK